MQTLLLTLFGACLTLVLHDIGLTFALYWSLQWFDLLLHGIGGFVIGSFAVYFFGHRSRISFAVAGAAVICWEVFEVVVVRIPAEGMSYVTDTATDILIGCAGILAARSLIRRL